MIIHILKALIMLCAYIGIEVNATTILYQDLSELSKSSEHVLKGTVKKIKVKERKGTIFTIVVLKDAYLIENEQELQVGENVKIKFKGGVKEIFDNDGNQIGSVKQEMIGSPKFKVGEEVLLFVSGNGLRDMPIVGWEQGKFTLTDSSVLTNAGNQIVGISKDDIIEKTKDGRLKFKGKILHKIKKKNGKSIKITHSDGGDDVILSRKGGDIPLSEDLYHKPMDKKDFIGLVKKKAKKNRNIKDAYTSMSPYFNEVSNAGRKLTEVKKPKPFISEKSTLRKEEVDND